MEKNMLSSKEKDRQALLLNQDYGLYIGNILVEDGKTKCSPMEYLEDYMSAHEQPPYAVCVQFLLQFYSYDTVADWTTKIAWNEDETVDLALEYIREFREDGTWAVILYRCKVIHEEFLRVPWKHLGLEDLVESGRVDQEMYAKQSEVVMEYVKESNQALVEMLVENIQCEIEEIIQESDMEDTQEEE